MAFATLFGILCPFIVDVVILYWLFTYDNNIECNIYVSVWILSAPYSVSGIIVLQEWKYYKWYNQEKFCDTVSWVVTEAIYV